MGPVPETGAMESVVLTGVMAGSAEASLVAGTWAQPVNADSITPNTAAHE